MALLEELTGGPLTLREVLGSIREGEAWSQAELGRRLGISAQHVSDIEHGRRTVSPERAAKFARDLGYSEEQFVRLALQAQLDAAGLKLHVEVSKPPPASRRKKAAAA